MLGPGPATSGARPGTARTLLPVTARRLRGAALALGLVLLPAAPAQAARYADPAGDDSSAATCPMLNPCDLETAVEDASVTDSDQVLLAPGTYTLSDEVTVDNAIELIGAGPFSSVIDSTAATALRLQPPGATVRGLGIVATASGSVALHLLGASTGERLSVISTGGAVACRFDGQATLRDSVCSNTNPAGFAAASVDSVAAAVSLTLRNVTAYAAGASTWALYVFADINNATVSASNSVFRTPPGGYEDFWAGADGVTADVVLDHSSFADTLEGAGGSISDPGSGTNIVAVPLFVNAAGGDFHQASGSPTIDKGSSAVAGLGTADIDGQARTQGANTDIGADEFVPAPAQPPAAAPKQGKKKKKCKKKGKKKSAGSAKKGCKKKKKKRSSRS